MASPIKNRRNTRASLHLCITVVYTSQNSRCTLALIQICLQMLVFLLSVEPLLWRDIDKWTAENGLRGRLYNIFILCKLGIVLQIAF
jgi:hypothetical protein